MATHLTTIGIPASDHSSLAHYTVQAIDHGQRHAAPQGAYYCWDMGNGAELWVQVNGKEEIIGLNPHYSGRGNMRIGLTERLQVHEDRGPLDGAFYGWAGPADEAPYPLLFDVPNFLTFATVHLPAVMPVQIAAFAHEMTVYRDLDAFQAGQVRDNMQLAPHSFIPTGLFSMEGAAPTAYAYLTGTVISTMPRRNHVTDLPFSWAKVQTLGGTIDVLADSEVMEGVLMRDSIVKGSFWLSGRPIIPAKRRPPKRRTTPHRQI